MGWLLLLVVGQFLSFIVAVAKAPDTPIGVGALIGVLVGVLLIVIIEYLGKEQGEAFRAVVRADRSACAEILARRARGGALATSDMWGTAALEVVAGTPDAARAALARVPAQGGLAGRLRACVEAHLDLVSPGPMRQRAALERLLAMPRFVAEAPERYRSLLIARAAALVAEDDPQAAVRALDLLASSRDPEAHLFTSWVRTALDAQIEPREKADEAHRAAMLAGAHGLGPLAGKIEARAAAIERERASGGPFRR